MSRLEFETYLNELAQAAATDAKALKDEERNSFVIGKMAALQTYLTSTGSNDKDALAVSMRFKAMVLNLLTEKQYETLH